MWGMYSLLWDAVHNIWNNLLLPVWLEDVNYSQKDEKVIIFAFGRNSTKPEK